MRPNKAGAVPGDGAACSSRGGAAQAAWQGAAPCRWLLSAQASRLVGLLPCMKHVRKAPTSARRIWHS